VDCSKPASRDKVNIIKSKMNKLYYQIQWWDNYIRAWHTVEILFNARQAADLYGLSLGKKYRIVEISNNSRKII